MRKRNEVIVLDRDGTIVIDRGYLDDPDGLEFEPHAAAGLRKFFSLGYRLVVVTNQSGVGRGLFPEQRVVEMHDRLRAMGRDIGVEFAGIYFCPHAPAAGCDCRKPALGLMLRAAAELGFDPACAVVIGDKDSDVEFGRLAGAKTLLISGGNALRQDAQESMAIAAEVSPTGASAGPTRPDHVVSNLLEAARVVEAMHAAGMHSNPE